MNDQATAFAVRWQVGSRFLCLQESATKMRSHHNPPLVIITIVPEEGVIH